MQYVNKKYLKKFFEVKKSIRKLFENNIKQTVLSVFNGLFILSKEGLQL